MLALALLLTTLGLWFPDAALFSNEAIFNYLVDVLFFVKITLEIKTAHVLTNIGLMNALWVPMLIPSIEQVLMGKVR